MQQSRRRPLILIFPFDLLSHYLRCLELAKRLKTAFDIQFADSCKYHSFIKQEGFETFKCLHLDSQQVMDCAEKFDFSWLNRTNLLPVYEAQVKIIQQLKPEPTNETGLEVGGTCNPMCMLSVQYTIEVLRQAQTPTS